MHDINKIRENKDLFLSGWKKRGLEIDIDKILNIDRDLRKSITSLQELQTKRNDISKLIGKAKKEGDNTKADELSKEVQEFKKLMQELEESKANLSDKLNEYLSSLPNIPHDDVPVGQDESSNIQIREFGKKSKPSPNHYEIGEEMGLLDFDTAAKLSGSRFSLLKKDLALLERSLANYMIDQHVSKNGYDEISVPYLVKDAAMYGTGQLPKFSDDQFKTEDGSWLIPTAEVPLTNMVSNSNLDATDLPLRYVAYTQCFRKEAGAAGKDTKGLIRLHQFPKVELVSIVKPESSLDELERLLNCAEGILKSLNLPYRVMILSSGDMGFSAIKTYDLEVWLPGQNLYREISSCSLCSDFQSRRMNTRFKDSNNKKIHPHTLNGSGLAVGRTLVAILENYYEGNGIVVVPDVLQPYMGGIKKIGLPS
ncbi:serine--tRNA ligase [Hyphomicrobiales bacterium]|jgi:seryl-tRNA synthetase|nr:serine--tRNA ligase [Hyphomicrobiales bacterium]|tara:strand:+ start:6229 stop:7500 length:1272 start_codon:yes stop_codon:yes gene_type:complete